MTNTIAVEGRRGLTYEEILRVIGRFLDSGPAYHISLIELDDGITVRYHATQFQSQPITVHFSHERLNDLSVFHAAARGVPRRPLRHAGLWGKYPDGHQEFLRSLGYALDQDYARCLTLDELDDEVRVTYVRPVPNNPVRSQKCSVTLRERDIEVLVDSARQRRAQRLSLVVGA